MSFLLCCFFDHDIIHFVQSSHEPFVRCDSHPIKNDVDILMREPHTFVRKCQSVCSE